jgi:hypothetical protein
MPSAPAGVWTHGPTGSYPALAAVLTEWYFAVADHACTSWANGRSCGAWRDDESAFADVAPSASMAASAIAMIQRSALGSC